jgi:hypothetical protein
VCDSSARVVCTETHCALSEKFFGFESFSIALNVPVQPVARIRVYPKPM